MSTNSLFQDFNQRAKEVRKYFLFLKNLEQKNIQLSIGDISQISTNKNVNKIKPIDAELDKTLKATGFLLLYNLVESTMRNAIETIYEELKAKNISFDQLRPEIKRLIIKNLKNYSDDNLLDNISKISVDIISASFSKTKLFSGNVDAQKIKEIAQHYGFSTDTEARRTKNGADLLTVKYNRNQLAHGWESFGNIGREKNAPELLEIQKRVVRYLKEILQNIEKYLNNQEYLDSSTSS